MAPSICARRSLRERDASSRFRSAYWAASSSRGRRSRSGGCVPLPRRPPRKRGCGIGGDAQRLSEQVKIRRVGIRCKQVAGAFKRGNEDIEIDSSQITIDGVVESPPPTPGRSPRVGTTLIKGDLAEYVADLETTGGWKHPRLRRWGVRVPPRRRRSLADEILSWVHPFFWGRGERRFHGKGTGSPVADRHDNVQLRSHAPALPVVA
jgi:hypothetical protein